MQSELDYEASTLKIGLHSTEVCREEDEAKIFCFNSQESLTIYNYQTSYPIYQIPFTQGKDNHVLSMCYSKKYELYFLYKENSTITLYTKTLRKLKTFTSKMYSGYNLFYLDDHDLLVSRTVSNLRFLKMTFKNYTKSGVDNGIDFSLTEGNMQTWNKLSFMDGVYFFKKQKNLENDILVVWSPAKVIILNLPGLTVRAEFDDTEGSTEIRNIVNVFYSATYGCLVIGYFNGSIKLLKIGEKKHAFIANLNGHQREILAFAQHPNPKWILSASADGFIIIWDLKNFAELIRFEVPSEAKIDAVCSHNVFFYTYAGVNYLATLSWQENFMISFLTSSAIFSAGETILPKPKAKIAKTAVLITAQEPKKAEVKTIPQETQNTESNEKSTPQESQNTETNEIKAVIPLESKTVEIKEVKEVPQEPEKPLEGSRLNETVFVMVNNLCVIMKQQNESEDSSESEEKGAGEMGNQYQPLDLYPPPKCSEIKCIEKCPYQNDRYYILSSEGGLFDYSVDTKPPKLLNYYPSDYYIDKEKVNIAKVTVMKFICFTETKTILNNDNVIQKDLRNQIGILALGTQAGHILFADIQNMKYLFARISVHKEDIIAIDGLRCKQESILVTYCKGKILKLSRLSKDNAELIRFIKTAEDPIVSLKAFKKRLFIGTENGNLGIFKMNMDAKKLYGLKQTNPFPDHSGDIKLLTILPDSKLVLTYSQEDNCLKCWNFAHTCLLQIYISECFILRGVECLDSTGQIALCYNNHATRLDLIRHIPPHFQQRSKTKNIEDLIDNNSVCIEIETFFQAIVKRKKSKKISRLYGFRARTNALEQPKTSPLKNLEDFAKNRSKSMNPSKQGSEERKESGNMTTGNTRPLYLIRKLSTKKEIKEDSKRLPTTTKTGQRVVFGDIKPASALTRSVFVQPTPPKPREQFSVNDSLDRSLMQDYSKFDSEETPKVRRPTMRFGTSLLTHDGIKNRLFAPQDFYGYDASYRKSINESSTRKSRAQSQASRQSERK